MTYIVNTIPRQVESKIDELSGFNDLNVSYDEWVKNLDQIFAQYHGMVADNEYVFESEAHYHWFLLAMS